MLENWLDVFLSGNAEGQSRVATPLSQFRHRLLKTLAAVILMS
jgi:hypothetical protein